MKKISVVKRASSSMLVVSFWVLTAVFCFTQSAAARPLVETKEIFYDIGGTTPAEIEEEIKKHAIVRENRTGPSWVKSVWDTEWRFWWRETDIGCRLTKVDSFIFFKNHLPNWLGEPHASPEMRARWRRTRAALDLYLQQSMSSGFDAAREIESLYRRIGTYRSCEELSNAFNRKAKNISKLYRMSEREIARRTESGAKQIPDLTDPIGAQTPVAGSPDKEIDGWCQMSSDLEIVRHEACHFKRSCSSDTEFCEIEYTWPSERIEIQYKNGEPTSWNDSPAGYAFINGSPCVLRHSDNQILCFFDRQPEGKWFYHLP